MLGACLGCAREVVGWLGAQIEPIVRFAGLLGVRQVVPPPPPEARSPAAGGPQAEVEEAKYYLGPSRQPATPPTHTELAIPDREAGDLPRAYGRDRLVLLVRDPHTIFAYWEVTPTTRVQALRTLGVEAEGAREVLRVYDVTFVTFTGDNAWLSLDVELTPGAESWYVNVSRPGASYCAEVGLRTSTGRFLPLVRSNTVTTPRSSPSPDTRVRWADLRHGAPARAGTVHWDGSRLPSAAASYEGSSDGAFGGSSLGSSDLRAPRPPAR